MEYFKRFITTALPTEPTSISIEEFKYLTSNFEHFSKHFIPSKESEQLPNDLIHQYTDFTVDEIIFKLFCNIESAQCIIESIDRLTNDEDTINSASYKTTVKCHTHWVEFMYLYFETSDKVENILAAINESRQTYERTKTFYNHYNIKKAATFTRRENVKKAYAALCELQKKVNLDLHKKYLSNADFDLASVTIEYLDSVEKDYVDIGNSIIEYSNAAQDLPLKDSLIKFAKNLMKGMQSFFFKLLKEIFRSKNFESLLLSKTWKFFAERACQGEKCEMLCDFDIRTIISEFLHQTVADWYTEVENSNFESFAQKMTEICVALREYVLKISQSEFARAHSINIDFDELFSAFLIRLKGADVIKARDFSFLKSLRELFESIEQLSKNSEALTANYNAYIQSLGDNLTVSYFYDCLLEFDIRSFGEFSITFNLESFLPNMFSDKRFEDYFKSKTSSSKTGFKLFYNSFTKNVFAYLTKHIQDFQELKQYCPAVERKLKLEMLLFNFLRVLNFESSKNDRKIEEEILTEPAYLQHKLKQLKKYLLNSYESFEEWKAALTTKIDVSLKGFSEGENLSKELEEIVQKTAKEFQTNEKFKSNYCLALKSRLSFSLLVFYIMHLFDILKGYYEETHGTELDSFGFNDKVFELFVDLYFEPTERREDLKDYITTLSSNLNLREESEVYFRVIFEKIIKDFKANFDFIEFIGKHMMTEGYSRVLQKSLARYLSGEIVFVTFLKENPLENINMIDGLCKLKGTLTKQLTKWPAEIKDQLESFVESLVEYLNETDLSGKCRKLLDIKKHTNVALILDDLVVRHSHLNREKSPELHEFISHIKRFKLMIV